MENIKKLIEEVSNMSKRLEEIGRDLMALPETPLPVENQTYKLIDEILNSFDFAKVYKVMSALNWTWHDDQTHCSVNPTLEEIKKAAHELLSEAANLRLEAYIDTHYDFPIEVFTGGFAAIAWCNEDKDKIVKLELKFIVSEWSAKDPSYKMEE